MAPEEDEEEDSTGDMSAGSVQVSDEDVGQDGDIHPGCCPLLRGSG